MRALPLVLLCACAPDVAWIGDAGYPSALQAVDRAHEGDVVELSRGTHRIATPITVPLELRGLEDGVLLTGDNLERAITTTAPITLASLTVIDGFASEGAAIYSSAHLTLSSVNIRDCRGSSLVFSDGGLSARHTTVTASWPGDALQVSGDELTLERVNLETLWGAPLRADVGRATLTGIELRGENSAGTVQAATLRVEDLQSESWIGLHSEAMEVTRARAWSIYFSGLGTASELDLGGFVTEGVDLEDVVVADAFTVLDATVTGLVRPPSETPTFFSMADGTLRNALLIDGHLNEHPEYFSPAMFTDGDATLEHVTWMGGAHSALFTGRHARLDQSIVAGVELRSVGFVDARDSFGWGANATFPLRIPWEVVPPQLDGYDLADDSILWGRGADGHPGAFGGEGAELLLKAMARAEGG